MLLDKLLGRAHEIFLARTRNMLYYIIMYELSRIVFVNINMEYQLVQDERLIYASAKQDLISSNIDLTQRGDKSISEPIFAYCQLIVVEWRIYSSVNKVIIG